MPTLSWRDGTGQLRQCLGFPIQPSTGLCHAPSRTRVFLTQGWQRLAEACRTEASSAAVSKADPGPSSGGLQPFCLIGLWVPIPHSLSISSQNKQCACLLQGRIPLVSPAKEFSRGRGNGFQPEVAESLLHSPRLLHWALKLKRQQRNQLEETEKAQKRERSLPGHSSWSTETVLGQADEGPT